jgi:phage terminase large subunit
MTGVAEIPAPFRATPKQCELAQHWRDRECRVVLIGGAIRSGKTQAAGRLIVETAVEQPSTYLVARLGYRQLEDSTKKAMLHGDGAMPPLIPPELVAEYRAGDNMVRLKTGSEILFRSLDEPSKLLNLTLGGVFVDQIEELDHGPDGERIFDTLLGRLSDPRGPRKLVAVANPSSTVSWQYRRLVNERTKDAATQYVHVTLQDNAANLPADYVEQMEATRTTRPHWYRSYVEGLWGSFEGAAYEEFSPEIHVVEPWKIPDAWERFESLDFGAANPTAVLAWAVAHDSELIVFDEYYEAGKRIAQHAPEILRRRKNWYPKGQRPICYADPSIFAEHGHSNRWGLPASIWSEFDDLDVRGIYPANNSRSAGFVRISELLHVEPGRVPPAWSSVPESLAGSPRLFIFSHCINTIEQLQNAAIALEGPDAGRAVDAKQESARLHAHAALRYGAMSRPSPSPLPPAEPEDPRAEVLRRYEERIESGTAASGRFVRV